MATDRSDCDDKRLLSLATRGDKKAFGFLYERYRDEIYRYAFYRVGDPHEAEDITANAFIKTWEHLPRIYEQDSSIRNLRSWLYQVARNLVVDHFRQAETLPLAHTLRDGQDSTKSSAEQNIEHEHLAQRIMELRPEYQQIIILRFVNQLSHEEVAAIMELNAGQTRVMQHRALKELREILSDE
jgi:RNA polymerase sigma-70 factor, ECF subfamily